MKPANQLTRAEVERLLEMQSRIAVAGVVHRELESAAPTLARQILAEQDARQAAEREVERLNWACGKHRDEAHASGIRAGELHDALALVLPLAKGYAAAHRFGSNKRYIEIAEQALAQPRQEEGQP